MVFFLFFFQFCFAHLLAVRICIFIDLRLWQFSMSHQKGLSYSSSLTWIWLLYLASWSIENTLRPENCSERTILFPRCTAKPAGLRIQKQTKKWKTHWAQFYSLSQTVGLKFCWKKVLIQDGFCQNSRFWSWLLSSESPPRTTFGLFALLHCFESIHEFRMTAMWGWMWATRLLLRIVVESRFTHKQTTRSFGTD